MKGVFLLRKAMASLEFFLFSLQHRVGFSWVLVLFIKLVMNGIGTVALFLELNGLALAEA